MLQEIIDYKILDPDDLWLERDEDEGSEITQIFNRVRDQDFDKAAEKDRRTTLFNRNIKRGTFYASAFTLLGAVIALVIAVSSVIVTNNPSFIDAGVKALPLITAIGNIHGPLNSFGGNLGHTLLKENANRERIFTDITHLRRKIGIRTNYLRRMNREIAEMQVAARAGEPVQVERFSLYAHRAQNIAEQHGALNEVIERAERAFKNNRFDPVLDHV